MTAALSVLKPADIIAVRLGGLPSELIRVGEELSGKPGLENHIAFMHHWLGDVPWGLEGRPGGVGWVDLREYLASPYTVNNCGQPGRSDTGRGQVAGLAELMLGTKYDWAGITDDTLRCFHMPDLFSSTFRGLVPGHVVCSSYAAFLYERQGWDRPLVGDRDTEPADWCALSMVNGWNVPIREAA